MGQQINLYQEELIDRPEPFQSRQSLRLFLVAIVCFALLGGFSYWQTATLENRVVELQQQQQKLMARVTELDKKYPQRQKSALLEKKIVERERELQGLRQALNYFTQQDEGQNLELLSSL